MSTLGLAFVLAAVAGVLGQKFDFENGVKRNDTCGVISRNSWWTEGSVTMTPGDLIGFEPKVMIHALHEVCTVDLTSCPSEPTLTSPQACFCKSRDGDRYDIHIEDLVTPVHSGRTLQAVVPGKGPLKGTFGATTIGTVPANRGTSSRVAVSFTLDDGPSRDLQDAQHVDVCPDTWFRLELCVRDGRDGADLMVHVGRRTNTVSGDACIAISHRHRSEQPAEMAFQYKEPMGCTQTHYIYLHEDAGACIKPRPSTAPCSAPTTAARDVPTTIEETTVEPEKRTTSATAEISIGTKPTIATTTTTANETTPSNVEGVCPDSPRTVTTLPSGHRTLTDNTSFGTSWTVFQRRVSGAVDFYRDWSDYVSGFGEVTDSFWLGLEHVQQMCNVQSKCELLIDLKYTQEPFQTSRSPDGCYYARYKEFWLGDATVNYTLSVSGYEGNAGDSLMYERSTYNLNHRPFSTFDNDNDQSSWGNCAESSHGAWWYGDCSVSNLNGRWGRRGGGGLSWMTLTAWNTATFSEMKVRRRE